MIHLENDADPTGSGHKKLLFCQCGGSVSRAPDSAAETRAPACQFFLCFLDPPPPPPPMCTGRGGG
jgi:hypothetical protein